MQGNAGDAAIGNEVLARQLHRIQRHQIGDERSNIGSAEQPAIVRSRVDLAEELG